MYVAFYGRVSTEEQADRGNITGQVEFAKRYFSLHGKEENIEGYGIYLDEGVSGAISLDTRPEGARLMADARAGKIGAVYFYRLDRLARSTRVVLDTYNELEGLNVIIKSMTESFDTGTPVGKFFMTLLASIAALERDTILERTQLGKERKAGEGCWTSGPPPFGYRINPDKRLAVYQPEAQTVRLIFQLYSGGMRMVPLAEYLNARSIPTPNISKSWKNRGSGFWQAGHISIILRSTVYRGEYRTMRRSKKGKGGTVLKVPAIVSVEEFERVGKIMMENGDLARRTRGRGYLLSGLIFCGHCGRAMVGNSGGNGARYYRCGGTINRGRGKECLSGRQIRADNVEGVVWRDIKEFFKNPGRYGGLVRQRLEGQKKEVGTDTDDIEGLKEAISNKRAARAKVLSLAARSLVDENEAEKELISLAAEIDVLIKREKTLVKGRLATMGRPNLSGDPDLLEKLAERVEKMPPGRDFVKLLVERVEVKCFKDHDKKNTITSVYYRFYPDF